MQSRVYGATALNHLRQLSAIVPVALVFSLFPLYMETAHGIGGTVPFVSAGIVLVLFVPQVALHLRYSYIASKFRLKFYCRSGEFVFRDSARVRRIKISEIDGVDLFVTRALLGNGFEAYPWQGYGYALIRSTAGECALVTTLVFPRMKIPVRLPNVSVRHSIYCWPPSRLLREKCASPTGPRR